MAESISPAEIANLNDTELLNLYLSLPPAPRATLFIDTAEAAKITGVSMRTIQLWVEGGTVHAILIGRKYRIVLESLRQHLKGEMKKRRES